ncbi:hypothetical protein Daus18300_011328 [Diaporthe australafricana]|uniref:Uncharacterized protein n=1 Tax=Diaporthe australafricana TaxID=127596 RepID=A0ABR3W7I2_9PEZI
MANSTKELRLRGLALKSYITWDQPDEMSAEQDYYMDLSFDRFGVPQPADSSSTQVVIQWDEKFVPDPDVAGAVERWFTMGEQLNSELLFLMVRSYSSPSLGEVVDGLVLWMLPHSAEESVLCTRMGTFTISDTDNHALGHIFSQLGLREGDNNLKFTNASDSEVSTRAGLVQDVTIV